MGDQQHASLHPQRRQRNPQGRFTITNAAGGTTTINLASATITTPSPCPFQINNTAPAGVTASINADGNGIIITDTSTGPGKLAVADVDNTTAADLNIAGTATANTINGGYEKTITVGPNDTLVHHPNRHQQSGCGVTAQIINDGSATAPTASP